MMICIISIVLKMIMIIIRLLAGEYNLNMTPPFFMSAETIGPNFHIDVWMGSWCDR